MENTRDELLSNLKQLITLLDAQGVDTSDYEAMMKHIATTPNKSVVHRYNELATNYNKASGRNQRKAAVEELLDFYHQHEEELEDRAHDIKLIEELEAENEKAEKLYAKIIDLAERGGYV